jgi:hypothetical protein
LCFEIESWDVLKNKIELKRETKVVLINHNGFVLQISSAEILKIPDQNKVTNYHGRKSRRGN